jgi:hypothetical protein
MQTRVDVTHVMGDTSSGTGDDSDWDRGGERSPPNDRTAVSTAGDAGARWGAGAEGKTLSLGLVADALGTEDELQLYESCEDELFDVLGNQRRRYVLCYLVQADEPTECRELARRVSAWESGQPPDEVAQSKYQSVYNSFYQSHFPTLEDAEYIEYDRTEGVVHPTGRLAELEPLLRREPAGVRGRVQNRPAVALIGGVAMLAIVAGSLQSSPTVIWDAVGLVAIVAFSVASLGLVRQ